MKYINFVIVALLLVASPARAQFPNANPDGVQMPAASGGPVAVGQAMAQVDAEHQRVAIIQAPAVEQKGGGLIQLSAFGWLQPYVDSAVQGLLVLGFGWFAKSKYGQMMDTGARDALELFVKNRASSLIADGAVRMQGKTVAVENHFLVTAANEASIRIPDALKRFGLTPAVVAQKIVDAIPQTSAGAAIVANAHADPAVPLQIHLPPTTAAQT